MFDPTKLPESTLKELDEAIGDLRRAWLKRHSGTNDSQLEPDFKAIVIELAARIGEQMQTEGDPSRVTSTAMPTTPRVPRVRVPSTRRTQ